MKKQLPSIISGFGAGVLQNVPLLKSFSCCILIPVASYIALQLERKSTGNYGEIKMGRAAVIGLLTGIYAALFATGFELIITFITKHNDIIDVLPEYERLLQDFPAGEVIDETMKLLYLVAGEIKETGFSFIHAVTLFISNIIVNPIFGLIGGLISAQIINRKNK